MPPGKIFCKMLQIGPFCHFCQAFGWGGHGPPPLRAAYAGEVSVPCLLFIDIFFLMILYNLKTPEDLLTVLLLDHEELQSYLL